MRTDCNLASQGFDPWFESRAGAPPTPECRIARVTAVNRESFMIRNGETEVFAEATGKLLFGAESAADLPCVGDWVWAQFFNDGSEAVIHAVLPRRSYLRRKVAGRRVEWQMIVANLDTAFVVQACDFDFNLRRLERYLTMIHEGKVTPVVLLSKCDLIPPEKLDEMLLEIKTAGFACDVLPFSNVTGAGHDRFRAFLEPGRTACLVGSSGVGKSTLLNRLLNQELQWTREIRAHDGRGRHATTRRQLVSLPGGAMLVDTPGLRELATIAGSESIEASFPEIATLSGGCRFSDCSHTSETGCSILEALQTGALSEERYQSFLKLTREAAHYQMTHAERRDKDKRFGKMIRSTLKQLKKN